MKPWKLTVPNIVYSGSGSIEKIQELIPKNTKNLFIVIDKNVEYTPFGKKVAKLLEKYVTFFWNEFSSDPSEEEILNAVKFYKKHKPECLIAIGGGSAIDAAKVIGLLGENYPYSENIFMDSTNKIEDFPYFIAVPTTCGTGAESSPYAVIKNNKFCKKNTIEKDFFIPKGVILDPDSLDSLAQEYRAATALDTLVHMLEVHTATTSEELVRIGTRGSLLSFGNSFEKAIFDNDKKALESLLYISFTTRLLYPRTGLSIAHSLAHPLGAYTNLHHGMVVAILMPEVIRFNENSCPHFFNEAAFLLKNINSGSEIASWIESILNKTGIYNIAKNSIKNANLNLDDIFAQTLKSSNMKSNPRKVMGKEDLKNLLNKVLEKVYE